MKQKRLWKRQTGSWETAPGKRRTSLIFALLFLAFLGIFDYPFIARIYNQYRQDAASVAYEDTEAALSPKTEIVSGSPNRTKLLRKIPWITTPRFGFSKTNRGTTKIRIASRIKMLAPTKIRSTGRGSDSASAL